MAESKDGWLCPAQVESMIAAAIRAANTGQDDRIASAVRAATSGSATSVQQMKKPTIPTFDPKNIDIWIRRMEASFDRLGITEPKLKFANLDEKIPSDQDPNINEFMWGAPTAARWNEFISYLRKKHGRTTKQKATSVIEGTDRDGRCPSQLWSVMKEKAGDVTLDDIMREHLLRRLPKEVRGHLQDKIAGKTGKEVADMADEYFDLEGNELNKTSLATGINAIRPALKKQHNPTRSSTASSPTRAAPTRSSESSGYTAAFEVEDESDINAVRFRQGQKQKFDVQNRSASRGRSNFSSSSNNRSSSNGRYNNNSSGNNSNSNSRPDSNSSSDSRPKICRFHIMHGENAENCSHWCILNGKFRAPKDKANQ